MRTLQNDVIAITGASGFVGRHFLRQADGLWRIRAHYRHPHSTPTDATIETIIDETDSWMDEPKNWENVTAVVHLAARAHLMKDQATDPLQEYRKANRDLTVKIATAALKHGVKKFIFVSSVKVMGESMRGRDIFTENEPAAPNDAYSLSKMEAEEALAGLFDGQTEAQCVILRLPLVFGPFNKGNMLAFLKAARAKWPLPLGSAKGKRSMVFVKNVAHAILRILDDKNENRPPVQKYFLHDDSVLTSAELYEKIYRGFHESKGVFWFPEAALRLGGHCGSLIEKIFGRKLPCNREVIQRLFEKYSFSARAFYGDYQWSPPYSTDRGIQETLDWFRSEK